MNTGSAKTLRNYLGPASWIKWLRLGLLAAMLVAFVIGVSVAAKEDDPLSAVEFYPAEDEMKGRYAYIDVVGVSDSIASRDTEKWYAVIDRDGYGNIVKMSLADFAALRVHNDWWYSDEEDFIDPTRIYGMPNKIPNELADVIAEVFEYDSRDEVAEIFGKFYLDTTDSPNEGKAGIILFLACMMLVAYIVILVFSASRGSNTRRCIRRLEQLGLTDLAASELDSPLTEIIGKDTTRIGESFIYCRPLGTVLTLSDILWAYGHIQRYNGVIVSQTLNAGTRTMKSVPVCQVEKGRDGIGTEAFSHIMEILQQRCPDVILGYSLENQHAYDLLFKEEKAKAKAQKN